MVGGYEAPTDCHFQDSRLYRSAVVHSLSWEKVIKLTLFILLCWFVDDSTMLETAQIEHAHATIGSAADKHVNAVGTEPNIVHLFVMCNQLCLCCECGDIPNGTGRVNAGRDYQTRGNGVPVERRNRCSMLGGLRIRQQCQR